MLTRAPLPAWRDLLRALLRRAPTDAELAAPWCREGEVAGWLSRSSWSLALIALWRGQRRSNSPVGSSAGPAPVVWVPDFFCNEPLAGVRLTGARLVFYPVTERMAPDMIACKALLEDSRPDIFVLVHYFGRPTAAAAVRDLCARTGAWLIEDAAHALRPTPDIGSQGDFVLYSPHKHLAIPDGAVLVVRTRGPGQLESQVLASFGPPGSWPEQLREWSLTPGNAVQRAGARSIAWLVKRLLQKLGVRYSPTPSVEFSESLTGSTARAARMVAARQSGVSRRLLAVLRSDLAEVARQRERHQLLWDQLLLGEAAPCSIPASVAERPTGRDWTPYLAAYRSDAAAAEAAYSLCRRRGIPVDTWPDLPPEVIADRERHAQAWRLRHSRLYLPLHQSLAEREIVRQCGGSESAGGEGHPVSLIWDDVTAPQWQEWLLRAARSNLLQSWAYGAAKADSSAWRVRRGVFYRGDEPIAFVQALQRRFAGLLQVTRINRGPLPIRELKSHEQRSVWEEVGRLGSVRHGRVVLVAPELSLSGPSLAMLAGLGFRRSLAGAWESVWIDLAPELATLRSSLDGKWRNMLVSAEKADLRLEVGSDAQLFDWMIARYEQLTTEKNFAGPPIELLRCLRRNSDSASHLVIFRALAADGEPLAGICIAVHGAAATYLLGWNGPRGRASKANQFLMWRAIMRLKESGLLWLDLGGINSELHPGITAFKLGLSGERYSLAGEYWKW